ncbi:MAG: hypothetical protein LBQ43_03705 [Holosporales bacterium]|jgi:hypothetical protein|nr:hypothetical protein [Holosporales bacterium]
MNFLNCRHIDDLFQISENLVRPTDGFNLNDATICVRARNPLAATSCVRVIAKIVPTYVPLNVFITYDIGKLHFERIPFKEAQVITNVQLCLEQIIDGNSNGIQTGDVQHGQILFEKAFPNIPPGSTLTVSHSATRIPVYSKPEAGTALPLWHIGGMWNGEEIESAFIFPQKNLRASTEAKIVCVFLSQTQELLPFVCVPREPAPWSLKECIERGDATINVAGHVMKSLHVEAASKKSLTITFQGVNNDE